MNSPTAAADLLRKVRNLVARGWTQDAWARDAGCRPVEESDPTACQWCVSGAFYLLDPEREAAVSTARKILCSIVGIEDDDLSDWNDAPGTTQSEVLAMLDRAALEAELAKGA